MPIQGVTVAAYRSHAEAETAVKTLAQSGIDMSKISIVGRDFHSEEQPVGYFNFGDRIKFFGKLGAFWGTIAGVLLGSFVLILPVFGHLVILGPLAASIVSGAEGAILGGGAGAVIGGLTAIGVPHNSALRYESALKADQFLLLIQGDASEAARAETLLEDSGAVSLETHAPVASAPSKTPA